MVTSGHTTLSSLSAVIDGGLANFAGVPKNPSIFAASLDLCVSGNRCLLSSAVHMMGELSWDS